MGDGQLSRATLLALVPEWSLTLSLIFAGCCSNALYLERATRIQPACGTLMTFLQFTCTTLQMLPTQILWHDERTKKRLWFPRIRQPKIPLLRWSLQVAMYFGTTILNNSAFSFHVPVPVHIIFRSGGLVVNMLAGYAIKGRRYSLVQIVSVVLVTLGVIIATLATTPGDGASSSASGGGPSAAMYFAGISLLMAALLLSSLMGLYQEDTFGRYGKEHWQEGLFYNHFLSMPLFTFRSHTLRNEWQMALADKQMWIGWGPPSVREQAAAVGHNTLFARTMASEPSASDVLRLAPNAVYDVRQWLSATSLLTLPSTVQAYIDPRSPWSSGPSYGVLIPILVPALAMNVLTQLVCVNGVNRLTAMCSSLTVTLILVVRKAVSLAISVLIIAPSMGEEVQGKTMLFVGASCVLLGTLGYAMGSASASSPSPAEKKPKGDSKKQKSPVGDGKAITTATEHRTNGQLARRH